MAEYSPDVERITQRLQQALSNLLRSIAGGQTYTPVLAAIAAKTQFRIDHNQRFGQAVIRFVSRPWRNIGLVYNLNSSTTISYEYLIDSRQRLGVIAEELAYNHLERVAFSIAIGEDENNLVEDPVLAARAHDEVRINTAARSWPGFDQGLSIALNLLPGPSLSGTGDRWPYVHTDEFNRYLMEISYRDVSCWMRQINSDTFALALLVETMVRIGNQVTPLQLIVSAEVRSRSPLNQDNLRVSAHDVAHQIWDAVKELDIFTCENPPAELPSNFWGGLANFNNGAWVTAEVPNETESWQNVWPRLAADVSLSHSPSYVYTHDAAINDQKAIKRGTLLLESFLDETQLREWKTSRTFVCYGGVTGQAYRVHRKNQINVDVLSDQGRVEFRLCAVPATKVTLEDHMLATKLLIEKNEDHYLKIAIRHHSIRLGY